jgi:hypothetical protein
MEYSDKWKVTPLGIVLSLLTCRVALGEWTVPKSQVEKIKSALDPDSILQVQSQFDVCTCSTGDNQDRCAHNFTFNQICKLRGDWHTSPTPEKDMATYLKRFNDAPELPAPAPSRPRHIKYFLCNRQVCRGFFIKCLGIDHRVADRISALVQGHDIPTSPPRVKPVGYEVKDKKYDTCVAFLQSYFGDQCQTSGAKHRYFPVNLSLFYIFNNCFWPWWKDQRGDWQVPEDGAPPGVDRELYEAIQPDESLCTEDLDRLFNDPDEEEIEHKHDEDWFPPDREQELQDLAYTLEVQEMEERKADIQDEGRAKATLKKLQRELGFPSFSTFTRARWDHQFDDVKKRPKHFHCRCKQCSELVTRLHTFCDENKDRAHYETLLKDHHFEVKRWRQQETTLQTQARSSPDQVIVLSFDDTSSMRFPRMTNRHIKTMPKDKVKMIPLNLTNHGTGENVYIYHFDGKWRKGADRLCTLLYHVLLRIKQKDPNTCTPSELAQRQCRKLVLMADNASENKNNCVFQFLTELVQRKWFDEIQLLYGPVGHTHNGNDAVHYIHNQIAGNFCSITPAELFLNYHHAWHSERTRPQPIIMEAQYSWQERFAPYQNSVKGFTHTMKDPSYVRAFRFSWSEDGIVVMHVKGSPTSTIWYGINSVPDGPGFVCLRGIPSGYPQPKEPIKFKLPAVYVDRLNSDHIKNYCRDNGRAAMHECLMDMARNLVVRGVPLDGEEPNVAPHVRRSRGGYSLLERIGRGNFSYVVPFIRNVEAWDESSFWKLPEDLRPVPLNSPLSAPALAPAHAPAPPPLVQYVTPTLTKRKKSVAAKRAAPQKRKTYKRRSQSDVSEDESESSPSEEKEEMCDSCPRDPVPEVWPALEHPLTVGSFVVIEVIYGRRRKETPGISVCEVTIF